MMDRPGLVTREPLNAETPPTALGSAITPLGEFYVRNHFPIPRLDASTWLLRLGGALDRPREITWRELDAMPKRELEVVLECAGNGRTRMRPTPPGTPWGERAVACGRFRGVPLRDLLEPLGIRPDTREIHFLGADHGITHGHEIAYERSLPLEKALHPDTLVATEMNGEPLRPEHGAPARLVVPGWYGVASVKWLVAANAITKPFDGFYQRHHYVYQEPSDESHGAPVTTLRVKSIITTPLPEQILPRNAPVRVEGWAWSGEGPILAVDVSDDGGRTWHAARLGPTASPHAWTPWAYAWTPPRPGSYTLHARATDAAGRTQPLQPPWNALGYGNNEVAHVTIHIH